jgi:excisionase family DNA binding protein
MQRLISVVDLSKLLGVSRSTVYRWAEHRMLPALKLGGRLLFEPSAIEAWLRKQRRADADTFRRTLRRRLRGTRAKEAAER